MRQAAKQQAKRKLNGFEIPNVGVAEAEHSLGLAYAIGTYVDKNLENARQWYEKAVEHGNANAANNLGLLYYEGQGVSVDLEQAEKLFLIAHKRGDNNAITNLVDLYLVKSDCDRALQWHERALANYSLFDINRDEEIRHKIQILKERKSNEKIPFNKLKKSNKTIRPSVLDIEMLKNKANEGSITAQNILEAKLNYETAIENYLANKPNADLKEILSRMRIAYRKENLVCQTEMEVQEELLVDIEKILDKNNTDELDLLARIAYMNMKRNDIQLTLEFINVSLKKYPGTYEMIMLRGSLYLLVEKPTLALAEFEALLNQNPNDCEVLFLKSSSLFRMNKFSDAIFYYKRFIERAPQDHCKIPESYYSMAMSYKLNSASFQMNIFRTCQQFYKSGLDAEKCQLPLYLPYASTNKTWLEAFLTPLQTDLLSQPHIEVDQNRIKILKEHRLFIASLTFQKTTNSQYVVKNTLKPPKTQKMPSTSISDFKHVVLRDIDFTKDHILEGYILNVCLIDVPCTGMSSIQLIIQDADNFVEYLSVYNASKIKKHFKIGTKFKLINPYIRMAADGKPRIRIDDPKTMQFISKIEKMCSHCGKEGSKYNCGKCLTTFYCSKECQVNDWSKAAHKSICQIMNSL